MFTILPDLSAELAGEKEMKSTKTCKYPRVLLINNKPICRQGAVGFTLGNLFRGWPKNSIAQIYVSGCEPDLTICNRNWKLEFHNKRMPFPLKVFVKAWRSSRTKASGSDPKLLDARYALKKQSTNTNRAGSNFAPLSVAKSFLLRLLDLCSHDVPEETRSSIREFQPQVIYSYLDDVHIATLVSDVSARYEIPVVPHFFDDWITLPLPSPGFRRILSKRLIRSTVALMKVAPIRFAVSDEMAREYSKRYHLSFVPFMNCIDPSVRPPIHERSQSKEKFQLAYVGGFYPNRSPQLVEVADALLQLRAEGVSGEIVIYPQEQEEYNSNIILHPQVRYALKTEERLLHTEDALIDAFLHIDNFESGVSNYLRFSMSAKIPWCLACGLPVFAYGPPQNETIQYVRRTQTGIVVDREESMRLREGLRTLLTDTKLRKKLGRNSRKEFQRSHNGRKVCDRFREELLAAAFTSVSNTASFQKHNVVVSKKVEERNNTVMEL